MLVRRLALCTLAAACVTAAWPASTLAQGAPKITSVDDVKSILVPAIPANAKEINEAIASAKAGDTVTLHGWVNAFNDASAEFTLIQPAPSTPGSEPAAPPAPLGTAVVRVADASGATVQGTLNGKHTLKPGAEVFVTGVVESMDSVSGGRVTLRAVSMHVTRAPLPADLFVTEAPAGAVDISEARKAKLQVGDEVVLRGRVGGSKAPFVDQRAVFTLVGRGLKACNESPADRCRFPWDYCCDPRDAILANSVTVQVADDKGQPVRTDMKGRRALKELSEVIIVGKVTAADAKSVVVSATRMHVVKP